MPRQRILALVAVLMGVLLLTAMLVPVSRQPVATAPDTGGTAAQEETVAITIDAAKGQTAEVEQGDDVQLRVVADKLDSVELRGLGMLQPVAPETPAEFDLIADQPGEYPIVLTDADEQVGTLNVTPRGG